MEKRDIIIIGAGPAGLTTAIYSARADLKPLVIEGYASGGQLMITTEVENFPGFSEAITGPELISEMRKQAEKFGAEFLTTDVTKVELKDDVKIVYDGETAYETKTLVISTGATANLLGIESETRLMGRGVSACATCDGFFFRDKTICVIGGGDSAMEEATFLTKFASKVYLIHRREEFRASKIMIKKAEDNPKIEFVLNALIEEVVGEEVVTGIKIKDKISGKTSTIDLDGVFLAIGHTPSTKLFKDIIKTDEKGYIITGNEHGKTATNIPGVFACGDVQDSRYQQAITAAASGCMAALDAEKYLEEI